MTSIDVLRKIEIFRSLNNDGLTKIHDICSEVRFKKDDRIFSEGAVANYLWIVVEGQVDLRFDLPTHPTSEENTITSIEGNRSESRVLGWSCFVPPNKYSLSAYCTTDKSILIRIEKESLYKIFEEDPNIGYKVMSDLIKVVGLRFYQLQEKVAKEKGEKVMTNW